jgi:hypothetical protein
VEHGDEVYGDEHGHVLMVIKLNMEKKKEKNKKPRRPRQRYMIGFCFALKTP